MKFVGPEFFSRKAGGRCGFRILTSQSGQVFWVVHTTEDPFLNTWDIRMACGAIHKRFAL